MPVAAPILLAKKIDGGIILCADYGALNKATVTNRFPHMLISEMLDPVRKARILMKLRLSGAYNPIRIKEGDENKAASQTPYSEFEYKVMPLGLTNTLATFQSYIDDCLPPYIDDFAVCYLDDILIYSANEKDHEANMREVLQ